MADLEHDVPNTPDTIFEAGSVSKQFTAAAVLLLARDGKLSLDDPVRKYIPELPDYGAPLTIRHMLTHTSGLRDWGSVAGIAGWPRDDARLHARARARHRQSRQKALNFTPGTQLVLQQHRLQPGGDHRVARQRHVVRRVHARAHLRAARHDAHVVARRLHAHRQGPRDRLRRERTAGSTTDMPFENVHGNGGLLTTVGDLLRWNENFVTPTVGDAAFVAEQQTPRQVQRRPDARATRSGSCIGPTRACARSSTADRRPAIARFLARYPDQQRLGRRAVQCGQRPTRPDMRRPSRSSISRSRPATAPPPSHTLTDARPSDWWECIDRARLAS